jgi:hypothetical protein
MRTRYLDTLEEINKMAEKHTQNVASILKTPFRSETPAELNALKNELNSLTSGNKN